LASGKLRITLDCECVRCLKPCKKTIEINDWSTILPLVGEEAVPVVNDCVDLTPFIREDTLLAFPQHPLCKTECSGLLKATDLVSAPSPVDEPGAKFSAWAELNKLKLN
jgi:uncharacterized protein